MGVGVCVSKAGVEWEGRERRAAQREEGRARERREWCTGEGGRERTVAERVKVGKLHGRCKRDFTLASF